MLLLRLCAGLFEKIIFFNRKALLYRVNEEFYQIPREVQERSIPVHGNSLEWILNEKQRKRVSVMAAISNDWLGPLSGEFKKPYYKKAV